ncbi:MAG: IclR family transcriptional regulator, acetate operon repressor, partial [Gaiellaceae bacterium]|nr:IclR family transcriptional regulator, acetate operon repressor [Gaiellaceae bacterium]
TAPPTHAELMRALEIPRSTLSDLLSELRDLGYVQIVDKRYLPGPRLLSFVYRATHQPTLRAGIRPTLEALAAATQETASYVIEIGGDAREPGQVVAVEQAESPQPIRFVAHLGQPFPITQTAAGRVFLAFTNRTGPAVLNGELERIRERGYALNVDESRATAVAAPVFDRQGSLVGAVSISGPSDRLREPEERVWPLLRDALQELRSR